MIAGHDAYLGIYLAIVIAMLIGITIMTMACLRGWRDWIALKHAELDRQLSGTGDDGYVALSQIEVADLKTRVKKLEAIAAGIDL